MAGTTLKYDTRDAMTIRNEAIPAPIAVANGSVSGSASVVTTIATIHAMTTPNTRAELRTAACGLAPE